MYNQKTKIAVVGVSADPEKYGHKIFRDLLANNYNVVGVNPKAGLILDQPIFPDLAHLSELPELVITVVPPDITLQIVQHCHELGIKNIWMQPGSDSPEAVQKAQQFGITVTWGKCFMKAQGIW